MRRLRPHTVASMLRRQFTLPVARPWQDGYKVRRCGRGVSVQCVPPTDLRASALVMFINTQQGHRFQAQDMGDGVVYVERV